MLIIKRRLYDEVKDGEGSAGAPAAPQPEAPVVEDLSTDAGPDWTDLTGPGYGEGDGGDDYLSSLEPEPAPEAPPTEPEVQPAAAAPEPQPEVPAPVLPPPGQPMTAEQVREAENAYAAQLVNLYQFDEDTALRLQTEPEKVLPALAAKLHLDVMKTVMAQVQGILPQAMERTQQASRRETEAKDMFFGAWPELKGSEQQVMQIGAMFRQMNPDADPQTAVQRIGELAMVALGRQRTPAPQSQQQNSGQPRPFRPASPGQVSAPLRTPNEWETIINVDEDD